MVKGWYVLGLTWFSQVSCNNKWCSWAFTTWKIYTESEHFVLQCYIWELVRLMPNALPFFIFVFIWNAGSQAYEKLCSVLNNIHLVKGIKQASPFAQTSCLEGFHSVLNHFAPKMIAFSYVGMYCRYNNTFFSKSIPNFTLDFSKISGWKYTAIHCRDYCLSLYSSFSLIIHQLKVNCNIAISSPAGIFLLQCISTLICTEMWKDETLTTLDSWNSHTQNSRMVRPLCGIWESLRTLVSLQWKLIVHLPSFLSFILGD